MDKIFGINRKDFAFYMAKDFFEHGIEVTKKVHPPEFRFGKSEHWKLAFPICAIAFSLELALKLYVSDEDTRQIRQKKKGHELTAIYNLISEDERSAIENHFETCGAYKFSFFNVRMGKEQPRRQTFFEAKEMILDSLEYSEKAFIQFRYMYEIKKGETYSFDFNNILRLIHACLAIKADELGIDMHEKAGG